MPKKEESLKQHPQKRSNTTNKPVHLQLPISDNKRASKRNNSKNHNKKQFIINRSKPDRSQDPIAVASALGARPPWRSAVQLLGTAMRRRLQSDVPPVRKKIGRHEGTIQGVFNRLP